LPEWRYSTASATECRPINLFGSTATCENKREKATEHKLQNLKAKAIAKDNN
jgi:hypothetical protein